MYELGDPVPLKVQVTNPATGLGVDPDTMVLSITRPDGTTITSPTDFALVHTVGTGLYSYSYVPTQVGLHPSARWVATGQYAGTWDDPFTVEEPGVVFISAAEALNEMRQSGATGLSSRPGDVDTVRWYCRVACAAVEADLNQVIAPRTVTETFDGGTEAVVLSNHPVISVTSVADQGTTLDPGLYVHSGGLLYRGAATAPSRFLTGRGTVSITYRAGYQIPPVVARKVAMRAVVRMWQQGQQLPHPGLDDIGAETIQYAVGTLTPLELDAYRALRARGLAIA
jgi:hypothetical protein